MITWLACCHSAAVGRASYVDRSLAFSICLRSWLADVPDRTTDKRHVNVYRGGVHAMSRYLATREDDQACVVCQECGTQVLDKEKYDAWHREIAAVLAVVGFDILPL